MLFWLVSAICTAASSGGRELVLCGKRNNVSQNILNYQWLGFLNLVHLPRVVWNWHQEHCMPPQCSMQQEWSGLQWSKHEICSGGHCSPHHIISLPSWSVICCCLHSPEALLIGLFFLIAQEKYSRIIEYALSNLESIPTLTDTSQLQSHSIHFSFPWYL